MTHPQKNETDPNPNLRLSLQNEMRMLRDDIEQLRVRITEDLPLPDHVRYISAISVAYTRLATLMKIERLLAGGEDHNTAFNAEFEQALKELEDDQ
jgi:hypothetical protein